MYKRQGKYGAARQVCVSLASRLFLLLSGKNSKSSLGAAPNTPIQERILTMHEFLFFMIGFLLGGIIGVTIMCLMQINRIHGGSNARKEDEEL